MSLPAPPDSERAALFRRLKPLCIAVSNYALRVKPNTTSQDLQHSLIALHSALLSVDDKSLINPALADYIFFPLAQVLKRREEWTDRVLESALGCLRILLDSAWSNGLVLQMFEQFCLMLVTIVEGKHKKVSEEVKAVGVGCLVSLFQSAKISMNDDATLRESYRGSKLRPLMGHTATVLLDVIRTEELLQLRIDALRALSLLYVSLLGDGHIVASFLPLTVSTIARALNSSAKTNHKVIVALVTSLRDTLCLVMDDALQPSDRPVEVGDMYHTEMTESWYRATKEQIKIALESFFPAVRTHSHHLVRESIIILSQDLIWNTSRTLDICQPLLLETLLSLQHDSFPAVRNLAVDSLKRLHTKESLKSTIHACLEECMHSWCLALPRTMSSTDDSAKVNLLQRIISAVNYFAIDNSWIQSSLESLLNTIKTVVRFDQETTTTKLIQPSQNLQLTFQEPENRPNNLVLHYSRDEKVTTSMGELLVAIGRTAAAPHLLDNFVLDMSTDGFRSSSDAWVALCLIRGLKDPETRINELNLLATDWLVESDSSYFATEIPTPNLMIALDILAYTAHLRGVAYRQSLIDILYPTLSLLSHTSTQIQSAARQTLEHIAVSTGYNNIQTLILQNTDYLINSVALKLNVFDVSVQVLATLYTVTKLAGPRIVPYMDDIWGSLFDVVDRFHGYEKLVTGVFAVMTGIVDVVSQSITFPSPSSEPIRNDTIHREVCIDIQELIDTIQRNEDHLPPRHTELIHPKPSPLPPKTASLLQNLARKSVLLTTHPSPHLRFNLIHLFRKSLPLLSIPSIVKDGDQDPFLPLLAGEVWPGICSKLTDKEPYIVNAALETIAELMALEGEFLGSKVEMDVWPAVKNILAPKSTSKASKEVVAFEKEAAIKSILAILRYSDQKPSVFDEMLETLWPWIEVGGERADEIRESFERKNGDAVWLMGRADPGVKPVLPGVEGFFQTVTYG